MSFSRPLLISFFWAGAFCLVTPNAAAQVLDVDGDTVPDDVDNCVGWWNYFQTDSDGDGLGDACDWCTGPGTDSDFDGLCDGNELCPFDWSPNNENVCDAEEDAGVVDAGAPDAGATDAGAPDAGVIDAGVVDAGAPDAGPVDAGIDAGAPDAGPFDAGPFDAGPFDAGVVDAGVMDAGVVDAGTVAGEPTSPECTDTGYTRYPPYATHSPLTCGVSDRLRALATATPNLNGDLFMKVGDSISYFEDNMGCFVGTQEEPFELADTGNGHLDDTRTLFSTRVIAGTTAMDRTSVATMASQVAQWATAGEPSPLDVEFAALAPQYAVVMFGANDIGRTSDPDLIGETTEWYAANMMAIADDLLLKGTVPIFVSLPPLGPSGGPTWMQELAVQFAQVVRGIAEMYQVPFVDIQSELFGLPSYGLRGDDVHLNEMRFDRRCNFTPAGMQYGSSVRNLRTLEALDRVQEVMNSQAHWDGQGADPLVGTGTFADPLVIDEIPFVASGDSALASDSPSPQCGTRSDHPYDVVFRLDLTSTTGLRAQIFDRAGSAHDIQMATASSCLDIGGRTVQGTFDAGEYFFYASSNDLPGEYLLVVQECLDAACDPIPLGCSNNYIDQDETGYDCGGPNCAPCALNGTCVVDDDCQSGACENGRCVVGSEVDAGVVDAGVVDAGPFDAGAPDAGDVDAGAPDAGPFDAGAPDAGDVDAGAPGAGDVDAGVVDAGDVDAGDVDAGAPDAGVEPPSCATPPRDSDGDSICDGIDVCPYNWDYFSQNSDRDSDGIGDGCDNCVGPGIDSDWDGVCDGLDNCIGAWNPDQTDSDGDGVGDPCE